MDYSLLVGVDEVKHELVLGIIDFMRQYTWDKHLENWVKASEIAAENGKWVKDHMEKGILALDEIVIMAWLFEIIKEGLLQEDAQENGCESQVNGNAPKEDVFVEIDCALPLVLEKSELNLPSMAAYVAS
ncbi:uncharacterized protein LOC109851424 isoform X1 [Asparagus officinalis]|uniref:uncharacterized protein LOC109851424 isoform X1 n=1 Tax=Asparagus officinalis TaxID=4686 RepID=UPI00098E7060|nr:uncharacterized protein LOC109851424 isoform X1 [Asparagus officinalis]